MSDFQPTDYLERMRDFFRKRVGEYEERATQKDAEARATTDEHRQRDLIMRAQKLFDEAEEYRICVVVFERELANRGGS